MAPTSLETLNWKGRYRLILKASLRKQTNLPMPRQSEKFAWLYDPLKKQNFPNSDLMADSIHEMIRTSFRCEDMVKCVLGLKSLDIEAYRALLTHGPLTTDRLGEMINRERSTAYRSLQNLITCGVVNRETRSLESGGYYHEYVAIEPWEMKQMVKKNVDEWYCQMNGLIEKMDDKVSTLILRMGDEETRT